MHMFLNNNPSTNCCVDKRDRQRLFDGERRGGEGGMEAVRIEPRR